MLEDYREREFHGSNFRGLKSGPTDSSSDYGSGGSNFFHPRFYCLSHLEQAAFEEVISGLDAYQLPGVGEGVD
jgi:hypothetical protein